MTTFGSERLHGDHLHLCPWPGPKRSPLMGVGLAEFAAPLTDRFVGHHHPTCAWPLFALAAAQAQAAQEPDGMTDDLGWTSVMFDGGG
jgi:hypothetical protein